MTNGIVRHMDELGRIVIPMEMRKVLGWKDHSKICITHNGNHVVLSTYHEGCCACGGSASLRPIRDRFICRSCVWKIMGQ